MKRHTLETREVACLVCGAQPDEPCKGTREGRYHSERTRDAYDGGLRLAREIKAESCPKCGAQAGEECTGLTVGRFHGQRLGVDLPDERPTLNDPCPRCSAAPGVLCACFKGFARLAADPPGGDLRDRVQRVSASLDREVELRVSHMQRATRALFTRYADKLEGEARSGYETEPEAREALLGVVGDLRKLCDVTPAPLRRGHVEPDSRVLDLRELEVVIRQTIADADPDRAAECVDNRMHAAELTNEGVDSLARLAALAVESAVEVALGETILTAAPDRRVGLVALGGGSLVSQVQPASWLPPDALVMVVGRDPATGGRTVSGESPNLARYIVGVDPGAPGGDYTAVHLRRRDGRLLFEGDTWRETPTPWLRDGGLLRTYDVQLSLTEGRVGSKLFYRVEVPPGVGVGNEPHFAETAAQAHAKGTHAADAQVALYSVEPAAGNLDPRATFLPAETAAQLVAPPQEITRLKRLDCYKPACGVEGRLCPDCSGLAFKGQGGDV